jgi:hypothetical protein
MNISEIINDPLNIFSLLKERTNYLLISKDENFYLMNQASTK